jgi:hypothetical protein
MGVNQVRRFYAKSLDQRIHADALMAVPTACSISGLPSLSIVTMTPAARHGGSGRLLETAVAHLLRECGEPR